MQFQAPFQIDPNRRNNALQSLDSFNRTASNIGDDAVKFKQNQAMLALQKKKEARDQAEYEYNYGPMPAPGQTPGQTPGAYSSMDLGRQPWATSPGGGPASASSSFEPAAMGPEPQGSVDYSQGQEGPQPQGYVDHTSHFNNWKSMGMPTTYDHPDYGGTGAALGTGASNPMANFQPDMYTRLRGIPGAKNQELFLKAQDEERKQAESVAKNGTGASGNFYAPEQVRALVPGKDAEALIASYPGGKIPKDAVHVAATGVRAANSQGAAMDRANLTLGQRDDQFSTKQWETIEHRTNPIAAPRGSGLGQAGINNMRADRALKILQNPKATDQQLSAANTDLAAIMHGGAPDEMEIKNQMYGTLQAKYNSLMTLITSNPQAAKQPEVQAKIKQMISEVKEVDNRAISDNLDEVEVAFADTIDKQPERWKKYRGRVLKTTEPPSNPAPAGGGGWSYVGPVGK